MKKYNCLKSENELDFCGTPTIKPLSKNDGIQIIQALFDEGTFPSYAWYDSNGTMRAFVINADSYIKDIGLGVKILGYQSTVKDISFAFDILPYVVRHLDIYNEENGRPYSFIIFEEEEILRLPSVKRKVESLGFSHNEGNHCFIKPLNNNASE